MVAFLLGMIAMVCITIGTFFMRFWKKTGDRFFLFFAAAFFIEAVERITVGLLTYTNEQEPLFYLMRLISFLVIIYAILDKNDWMKKKNL